LDLQKAKEAWGLGLANSSHESSTSWNNNELFGNLLNKILSEEKCRILYFLFTAIFGHQSSSNGSYKYGKTC